MALIELHLDTPVRERTGDEATVAAESTTTSATESTDAAGETDTEARPVEDAPDTAERSGGRIRRLGRRLAVLGVVVGAAVAIRRFRGGDEDEPPEI